MKTPQQLYDEEFERLYALGRADMRRTALSVLVCIAAVLLVLLYVVSQPSGCAA